MIQAVDNLTINEENRLCKEVVKLTKKSSKLESMENKHRKEIEAIRKDMETKFQQIVTRIDIGKIE